FLCHVDRCQRFRQRADLIYLDQNGIRYVLGNSFLKKFHVGDEKIVTDQLNPGAQFFCQFFPAVPIVLRATVLDRNDREPRAKRGVIIDQFFSGLFSATRFLENVKLLVTVIELRGSGVERDEELFAQLVTSLLNGRGNRFQRLFSGIELRRKSTSVANG